MFTYTENVTESDKHIKNNNLLYKAHQQYKNTLNKSKVFEQKKESFETSETVYINNSINHI